MATALDYTDFLCDGHCLFPLKYCIDFIETVESIREDPCIIMSVSCFDFSCGDTNFIYQGMVKEEVDAWGDPKAL